MAHDRFMFMYSCFLLSGGFVEEIEVLLVEKVKEVWIPSSYACADESMVPFKGRKDNPHHVYIMRKLHPHGIKVCSFLNI